jgi:hypothetical protein
MVKMRTSGVVGGPISLEVSRKGIRKIYTKYLTYGVFKLIKGNGGNSNCPLNSFIFLYTCLHQVTGHLVFSP